MRLYGPSPLPQTSLSPYRISDYKHHWSDVLSGAILGLIAAVLIHWFAKFCLETDSTNKKRKNLSPEEEIENHLATLPNLANVNE